VGQLTWDGLVPGDRERVLPEKCLLVRADQPHEIREMSLLVHVDQVDENSLLVRADQDGIFLRAERNPDDGA
jgi:hypothetical protein